MDAGPQGLRRATVAAASESPARLAAAPGHDLGAGLLVTALAERPFAVRALQRVAGNRAVAAVLAGRTPNPARGRSAPPVLSRQRHPSGHATAPAAPTAPAPGPTIPQAPESADVRSRIVEFANQHYGQRVGRGECGDLAIAALAAAGAEYHGHNRWGTQLPSPANARPGDILQFDQYGTRLSDGMAFTRGPRPHGHTAVVVGNPGDGTLLVSEQNMTDWGSMTNPRRVQAGTVYLRAGIRTSTGQTVTAVSGQVYAYRPVPQAPRPAPAHGTPAGHQRPHR